MPSLTKAGTGGVGGVESREDAGATAGSSAVMTFRVSSCWFLSLDERRLRGVANPARRAKISESEARTASDVADIISMAALQHLAGHSEYSYELIGYFL